MTVEARPNHLQGAQEQPHPPIPFSQKELPNNELSQLVQQNNFDLARVVIGMKEFQEAYRNQREKPSLKWKVGFIANFGLYDVESELIADSTKLVKRRLEVTRREYIMPPVTDAKEKFLCVDGPFVEERVVLVMSENEPTMYYFRKRSDSGEYEEHKNTPLAHEKIKNFTVITRLLTHVIERPSPPSQKISNGANKVGDIVVKSIEPEEPAIKQPQITDEERKRMERWHLVHNPAYRNRQLRKFVEDLKWKIKLRTKFRRKAPTTAAS